MDKTDKFIQRLSAKERKRVQQAILDILAEETTKYDTKKLRGHANVYRLRVGQIRIIYIEGRGDARILMIDRRNDNTYRDF